jgi:hypothetical protein
MNSLSTITTAGILGVTLAMTGAACKRNTPAPEMQTTTVQPQSEPAKATGCLRAGMAENTFVLITAAAGPENKSTTYQLTGHDVALRDYVGQQVEVSGTVQAKEQVASEGVAVEGKPTGTGGTPTVETTTQLEVKQMAVNAVTPMGGSCAPALPSEDQPPRRIK